MSIGRENQELIQLGKAWCTHIRTDRSAMGVGMVEEMTGLPITGGRFTCDFARNPGGLMGMQLVSTAVSFYENNCRDCPDRSPGGRVPNLSTWAEPLLAERDEREAAASEARQASDREREERAAHRRLVSASFSAASQEVIELVNRIDLDGSDTQAAESLRATAQLAPDAFSDPIKEMLYQDARLLRSPLLLELLVALDSPSDPAVLHSLCKEAVRDGWGRSEGCRHLCEHGTAEDLNDDFVEGVVFHAAPAGWGPSRRAGDHAALIHYHSLAPEVIESVLEAMLRHGEAWRRAAAASATHRLQSADHAVGTRLLSALLDALRFHEDWQDYDSASGEVAAAVGIVLLDEPHAVESVVDARWPQASPEYRARMLGCFDTALRHRSSELRADVAEVVLTRATKALSESADRDPSGFEEDYEGRASDLLKIAVASSPATVLSAEHLLGLLLVWLERERAFNESEPEGPLGVLEKMGGQARIGGIVRDIAESVVAAGHREPGPFLVMCDDLYRGSESTPSVRAEIVRIAGSVACQSFEHVNNALPLIYTAMLGESQAVRAAGLNAAKEVVDALPTESIPPLLAEAVVAGLTDQYLIVVVAAVEAMQRLPADLLDYRKVAINLLMVARAYARERLRDRLVQDALAAAIRLANNDETFYPIVRAAALETVGMMPAASAREILHWHSALMQDERWVDVAIHSLRMDDDSQYEHLGGDDKEALLRELGRRQLSQRQLDALATNEVAVSRFDRGRSLLSADVFGELNRPDLASSVIRAHLEGIPDTIEKATIRRAVRATLLRSEFEEAIATGDDDRRLALTEEIEVLCDAVE